jgi:hypothetical protein
MLPNMPNRQDMLATTADLLGAPVDGAAWMLKYLGGVPIPGQQQYYQQPRGLTDFNASGAWLPSKGVPFGSQYWRNAFDNPPSIEQLYRAMRRHGLF